MAKKKIYTKPLALLVTEEVHRKVIDLCDQQEISISEWLRGAIETQLDRVDKIQNKICIGENEDE